MTAETPEGGTFQLTADTLAYDPGDGPGWGVDCPTCGSFLTFLDLVDGATCDCGTSLVLDVVFAPGRRDAADSPTDTDDDANP